MYCRNCGKEISETEKFCPNCGSATDGGTVPEQNASNNGGKTQPEYNMGWYKFLIYFSLFAAALINLVYSIKYFTGAVYGDAAMIDAVYDYYPALKTVDILSGIIILGIAVLALFTRFMLADFRRIGLTCLYVLYGANFSYSIFYLIIVSAITSLNLVDASYIVSITISIVFFVVNLIYFGKRKELFNR